MTNKKNIGILGASGYTGSELVRILLQHPNADIKVITSESHAGKPFHELHQSFTGIIDKKLVSIDKLEDFDLDLVFLALPHGTSMNFVKKLSSKRYKIIDLSGDFRLSSPDVYESWYKKEHIYKEGFKSAVYGLPELFFEKIKTASLVANPGCYPTSAILGLAPLLSNGLINYKSIIIDSKSGITGAGVKPKEATHFSNVNDNFKAYGLKNHRHSIEIQEILSNVANNETILQFTPHLLPVDRGIISTMYCQPSKEISEEKLKLVFQSFYEKSPFVRLLKTAPEIKNVRGSNFCDIYLTYDERTNLIIVISAIDNLVKGAAGQAIQNMNIMSGWEESMGLLLPPLNP